MSLLILFFFFKQKTAYEMRISDWSSDVCSSDLARPAASISLADIIEAVEGPIAMTACIEETRHECALEENCRVRPHWSAVNGAIRGALAGVTLDSLAGEIA